MYSWILSVVILIVTYLGFKVYQFKKRFKKYGIPQPDEIPFLGYFGTNVFKQQPMPIVVEKLYNFNREAKYIGFHNFSSPVLLIRDLELIKSVLVKNFEHFSNHAEFIDESVDPLFGKNLVFLNGEKWKEVRNLLTPSFTLSKLRCMFDAISNCAENFTGQFLKLRGHKEAVDLRDAFSKYTNDVIAICAFGVKVDSVEDPDNDFYTHSKLASLGHGAIARKVFLFLAFPNLSRKLGIKIMPQKVTDFFVNLVDAAIKTRDEKGITRPDMLQLMMDARGKTKTIDLSLLDMTAQSLLFILGGLDSTSDNLCMISYELATNPDVQKKLHNEIEEMMRQCNNKPTYESINNLPYLNAVFMETQRLHPMPLFTRVCSKEFELPPALPGLKPYVIKAGEEIFIPVSGIHHDEKYYENPHKFNPERYCDKKSVISDVLSLGFGFGPRICLGAKFAILETKVLLVHLLSKCEIVPSQNTCIPLEYSKINLSPAVKGGCWLKLIPKN